MKRKQATSNIKLIAGILFSVSAFIISGCGGGNSPVIQTNPYTADKAAGGKNPSDSVVVETTYYSEETISDPYFQHLLQLEQFLLSLPDDVFKPVYGDIALKPDPRKAAAKLQRALKRAGDNIKRDKFDVAIDLLSKNFIPYVDGCSGGSPADDIFKDCNVAVYLYDSANNVIAMINMAFAEAEAPVKGKKASLTNWEIFKAKLIDMIADMQTSIETAPVTAFVEPSGSTRDILLEAVYNAMAMVEAGDVEGARAELNNNLYIYIDGGLYEGDPSDDLVNEWFYYETLYNDLVTSVENFLETTTIIAISVSPDNTMLFPGETQEFAAVCTYSDNDTKDCSEAVSWSSSNPAVGTMSGRFFTAAAAGVTTITASLEGITSNAATVEIYSQNTLSDTFNEGTLNRIAWSDYFTARETFLGVENGALRMAGPGPAFGQVNPTEIYYLKGGETVIIQIDFDITAGSGLYYVQGFGMMESNRTGLAAGIIGGTHYGNPVLYFSSPNGYGTIPCTDKGRVRLVYLNGVAKVYLNDMTTHAATINAYIDNKYVNFFLYSSAVETSTFDVKFDNFWTSLKKPAPISLKIDNLTTPFGPDGSGTLSPGQAYKITVTAPPQLKTVQATLLDPDTNSMLMAPLSATEKSAGVYEVTGIVPEGSFRQIAATGSTDRFASVKLNTRRIETGAVLGRVATRKTDSQEKPLPAFLLPMEMR